MTQHRPPSPPWLSLARVIWLPLLFLLAACQQASGQSTVRRSVPARPDPTAIATPIDFDGLVAFEHVAAQLALGERYPGTPGHLETRRYIREQLEVLGWEVAGQPFDVPGFTAENLIARANVGAGPVVILGAHYDTRRVADQSPGSPIGVPGAVDGASGVAVLLELARSLDLAATPAEVWLAFFDAEDNGSGGMAGWDWILGSTYMAANLEIVPSAMVLVDMVGDADQQLYYEGNSDPALRETLWEVAADLGYGQAFIPQLRYTMIDDHLPFARLGIPAVDIIDFDYPYWHTMEDTLDKVGDESLERVGRTVEVWLEEVLE